MDKELLLKSDIIDIIFENKNKAYGAYNLRKYYNSRLNKALGLMLCFVVFISIISILHKKQADVTAPGFTDDIRLVSVEIPKVIIPEVKPAFSVTQPKIATTKFMAAIKIVPENESIIPLGFDPDNTAIGNTNNSTTNTGGPSVVITGGTGSTVITDPVMPEINREIPMTNPDMMPAYPGGMDALKRFLEKNLHNPKEMEEGESVSVSVKFVVGYDGKLKGFVSSREKEEDEDYYKEVIRVLKKMPEWIPGKSKGENISAYYAIPVRFVPAD